jgi:hypothetical protein
VSPCSVRCFAAQLPVAPAPTMIASKLMRRLNASSHRPATRYALFTHHTSRDHSEERSARGNPDQQMLFHEVEVLTATEAAAQAHAARTSEVEAHERKRARDTGRKAIPEYFPRIVVEHDFPAQVKMCMNCAVPHELFKLHVVVPVALYQRQSTRCAPRVTETVENRQRKLRTC